MVICQREKAVHADLNWYTELDDTVEKPNSQLTFREVSVGINTWKSGASAARKRYATDVRTAVSPNRHTTKV